MVTLVGSQTNFLEALQCLAELDFDAIEAYETAIDKIENPEYKMKLNEFKEDHVRHTMNIKSLLEKHHGKTPTGPTNKQWLTKGKVMLGNLIGDKAILIAMISNEIDTNTAYERLNYHENKWSDAVAFLKQGLEDEKRHKHWLQTVVSDF